MRLFLLSVATLSTVWSGLAQEAASQGQLFRGPVVQARPATLVAPDRPLPLEFDEARLDLGNPAPWAPLSRARLSVGVRSNTLRPVTVRGITLRVAVGPAEHGMFTFRMRGIAGVYAPEEFLRLPADGLFRPLTFATVVNEPLPQLLLMNPRTRIVFTLERLDGVDGPVVFENPDATELLWEALGQPGTRFQVPVARYQSPGTSRQVPVARYQVGSWRLSVPVTIRRASSRPAAMKQRRAPT